MQKNLDYIKQNIKNAFWVIAILSAVINILMLVLPIYSLQVLDRVISSGSRETLLMLTILVGALLVFFGVFSSIRDFVMSSAAKWLDAKISPHLVNQTYDQVVMETKRLPSQNLRDFEAIKNFMASPALKAIFDAPWSIVFLLVLFLIHPYLAAITLIAGVVILLIALLSEKNLKQPQERANELYGSEMYHVDSFHKNSMTIKALRMNNEIKKRWMEIHNNLTEQKKLVSSKSNLVSNSAKSFRMIIQMLITGIGAYLVLQQEMTVGGMIAASILSSRVLAPFEVAISAWTQLVTVRKSYKNIKEVSISSLTHSATQMKLPEPKGEVSFKNMSFKFDPKSQDFVLQGINLKIEAGESLCVIGPSASGKSTLAALMLGIWKPNIGSVRIDGAEISQIEDEDYGQYLGYLSQNIEFFEGTVKENIARMSSEIDDKKVLQAAKISSTHEMILGLPNGYETIIGKSGHNLSSGQKQRLALARAFYGNPKLIVLDEPNSNLDEIGDMALVKAIKYAKSQKVTIVVITHRPAILDICDKALVINQGKIMDYGDVKTIKKKFQKRG